MSKPKQYDRDDLLNQAIEVFRRQGYNGTSTAELASKLGVNKKSMYSEFGSKQGLFEASLRYYNDHHLTHVLAPLESSDSSLESIIRAFYDYASAVDGPYKGLGCLLCNTAVERGALEPGIGAHIDAYFERISRAFRNALTNARKRNQISAQFDLDEMAGFLTTVMIGMSASIRAEAPPDQLWSAYRVVSGTLEHPGSMEASR